MASALLGCPPPRENVFFLVDMDASMGDSDIWLPLPPAASPSNGPTAQNRLSVVRNLIASFISCKRMFAVGGSAGTSNQHQFALLGVWDDAVELVELADGSTAVSSIQRYLQVVQDTKLGALNLGAVLNTFVASNYAVGSSGPRPVARIILIHSRPTLPSLTEALNKQTLAALQDRSVTLDICFLQGVTVPPTAAEGVDFDGLPAVQLAPSHDSIDAFAKIVDGWGAVIRYHADFGVRQQRSSTSSPVMARQLSTQSPPSRQQSDMVLTGQVELATLDEVLPVGRVAQPTSARSPSDVFEGVAASESSKPISQSDTNTSDLLEFAESPPQRKASFDVDDIIGTPAVSTGAAKPTTPTVSVDESVPASPVQVTPSKVSNGTPAQQVVFYRPAFGLPKLFALLLAHPLQRSGGHRNKLHSYSSPAVCTPAEPQRRSPPPGY